MVFASCVPGSFDGIIDCVSSPDDYNYVPEGSKLVKPTSGHYVAANSAKVLDWIQLFTFGFGRGQYKLMVYKANQKCLNEIGLLVGSNQLKINIHESQFVPFEDSAIRTAIQTLKTKRVRGKLIVKMDGK